MTLGKKLHKEGYEAGVAKGVEQGLAQGLEQGIYKKSVDAAKAMLADGMDVNLVAKYTGLSV